MKSSALFLVVAAAVLGSVAEMARAQDVGAVGGAYGGRYTAYGASLAAEASVTKSYAVAIFSWSYIGLYIAIALLGIMLTWVYFHVASGAGASANQVITIVTSTVIFFVLLLLLIAVMTGWALGVVTP